MFSRSAKKLGHQSKRATSPTTINVITMITLDDGVSSLCAPQTRSPWGPLCLKENLITTDTSTLENFGFEMKYFNTF